MTVESRGVAFPDAALCECGHPIAEHAASGWGPKSVCVTPVPDDDNSWYGVCACVRCEDGWDELGGPDA
jgi:hypothetical protein